MRLCVSSPLLSLVAAFSIFLALNASAIVFDDGLVHVIDAANSFPFESAEAIDSASGHLTTLNVVDGGAK